MLWGRRRLQRLEDELARALADQASLRSRLDLFETIAAAAGTTQGHPVPVSPMPAGLVAAGREVRSEDFPVRLDVAGSEVIAVIGGEGDPREWWNAIWHLATEYEASQ
jgi:hypothetical protein